MLDTIHLHIEERSVCGPILKHGSRIRHFHLCESNGGAFGTGAIDFPQVLAALKQVAYDGFISYSHAAKMFLSTSPEIDGNALSLAILMPLTMFCRMAW
jgi:sugar phosphate isomerase/epimerase